MTDFIGLAMVTGFVVSYFLGTIAKRILNVLLALMIFIINTTMFIYHVFFTIYQVALFIVTWRWWREKDVWKKLTVCKFTIWWRESITHMRSLFTQKDNDHY